MAGVFTRPIFGNEGDCSQGKLANLIGQLSKMEDAELTAFSQCGLPAVPVLTTALTSSDYETAYQAAQVLYLIGIDFGSQAQEAVPTLRTLLQNHSDMRVRLRCAYALETIAPSDSESVEILRAAFQQPGQPDSVREAVAQALSTNSQGEPETIVLLLDSVLSPDEASVRLTSAFALAEIVRNHKDNIDTSITDQMLEVIQNPGEDAAVIDYTLQAIDNLDHVNQTVIDAVLATLSREDPRILEQASITLSNISEELYQQSEQLRDIDQSKATLLTIQSALSQIEPIEETDIGKSQAAVAETLLELDRKRQLLMISSLQSWTIGRRAYWLIHPLLWGTLIFIYPRSAQIQAVFFWNKYVRGILGCWYVGVLLTLVPPLRQRLFAPFKESLLADAKLDTFDLSTYFADSEIILKDTVNRLPVSTAIPKIKGQIILEGESGLGKTMLLRRLVSRARHIMVYLPAQKCEHGVIEAIQAKLHGQAQDAEFLRHLIYSGALDICIDGLNEVRPDIRANITAFVESYFKGNIIMTTQPLVWIPPATAKTYVLQALHKDQIKQFLIGQCSLLDQSTGQSTGGIADYENRCTTFLDSALDAEQPPEDLAAARRILSNPMDLSVVGQILGNGLLPDLLQLQQQQYDLMAQDYQRAWNQVFPLSQFSEFVYQMRLADTYSMTGDTFFQALLVMENERHRMVLSRQWQDLDGTAKKEWSFRHDKIMEFFLAQPFLGSSPDAQEKRLQHLGDPRFRGVYLLLARLLPLEAALDLREALIQYAADTQDHTVSDRYVQIVRSRQGQ